MDGQSAAARSVPSVELMAPPAAAAAAAGARSSAAAFTPTSLLVTGGAGFIGSHFILHLMRTYPTYRVVNYDRLDYCSSLKNLRDVEDNPNYRFVQGDVRNTELLVHVMRQYAVDTVLHFAAQSHVDNAFGNSMQFTSHNVLGTHSVLEASRIYGKVLRFVLVSSDEVYGQTGHATVDEASPLRPTQPYSATKAAAEMIAQAYRCTFNTPLIITRGNNVYGPHQYPEKIVPKFISLLMDGRKVPLHGDGSARRSFIYATDAAEAFDLILHFGALGEIYNMGTEIELNMREVAHDLVTMFGFAPDEMIERVADRAFNDDRYSISYDKLAALGWSPRVPWRQGIERTVAWYRANRDHWEGIDKALVAHPRIASRESTAPALP